MSLRHLSNDVMRGCILLFFASIYDSSCPSLDQMTFLVLNSDNVLCSYINCMSNKVVHDLARQISLELSETIWDSNFPQLCSSLWFRSNEISCSFLWVLFFKKKTFFFKRKLRSNLMKYFYYKLRLTKTSYFHIEATPLSINQSL